MEIGDRTETEYRKVINVKREIDDRMEIKDRIKRTGWILRTE